MFDRYYDEIEIGERRQFDGGTVSETHVVNFAGLVGDHFPLHVNAEYAAGTQFGQQVAHGFLVLSLSSGMFPMKPGAVVAFYGMDEVRFIKPTFFGDTLHIVQEVIEKRDREPGGVVSVRQQIINQRDEVVNSAILRILMASAPATD